MRCPKCGFISFDHLTSCAKCGRDVSEAASELQGTSIKAELPMFLGTALAAYSEREESFEDHAMEAEVDEGIDFSMEEEVAEEEVVEVAAEEDVDFSFEEEVEEEETADISLAEAEAEEAAGTEEAEEADFTLEAEADEEVVTEEAEDSFEELDFMSAVDEEEDSGLEFDLEDFLEEDDDTSKKSGAADESDIDLNLDDE